MKKISVVASFFLITTVFGQKVSDYKYISVPEKFKDFDKESYGLETALVKGLTNKKYTVFNGKDWPAEVKDNPCSVLYANVLDNSSFLKNKVLIEVKDCNEKVVFSSKGSSSIKEYKEGFQDALKQAVIAVPVSYPVEIVQTEPAPVQSVSKNETSSSAPVSESTSGKYTNGKLNLQKIQVDTNQFILADSGSSVPFAVFKTSSKKDVFRVKLADGTYTIGYFENGNIVIDIPQSNGGFVKEVFSSK
ncbi:hypothetical protein B0A69_14075 [Chryseobacterium shigense]|uniref:Uncharacterized protein n=1 Tax=Chryseobacterium shigense TaxID=297244 RepID=A0A1N7JC11_9FLAO|nr:hypothetical protein [Chryseobacterium shigense]PQA92592.1 hypothetical protein B0A69_14075 [Chryseobacterium shigense]SIS46893.1 hypothetical protein SAMN05421639_1066 [Chryseobacterium shigense]